jgi:hypothetical protein
MARPRTPSGRATPPPKADLWSEAPAWRSLLLTAIGLTAAAVALPLTLREPRAPSPAPAAPAVTPAASPAPAIPSAAPAPSVAAPAAPRIIYVPRDIPAPAAAATAPPSPPAPPPAAANALPAAATTACTLRISPSPSAMGAGTVTGFQTQALATAYIGLNEQQIGGKIDPDYVNNLRAEVRMDNGATANVVVPRAMAVRVGDRVTAQRGYRNALLPCNFIPPLVTADLGPGAAPSDTPKAAGNPP